MDSVPSTWITVAIASAVLVFALFAMGLFGGRKNHMPLEGKV